MIKKLAHFSNFLLLFGQNFFKSQLNPLVLNLMHYKLHFETEITSSNQKNYEQNGKNGIGSILKIKIKLQKNLLLLL